MKTFLWNQFSFLSQTLMKTKVRDIGYKTMIINNSFKFNFFYKTCDPILKSRGSWFPMVSFCIIGPRAVTFLLMMTVARVEPFENFIQHGLVVINNINNMDLSQSIFFSPDVSNQIKFSQQFYMFRCTGSRLNLLKLAIYVPA